MYKILFIDDEPIRANSYAQMWDVRVAHGSSQIAFCLKHNKFDLIMLDHDMPQLDGGNVIKQFWEDFHLQNCPIIIHSANTIGALKMYKQLEAVGFKDVMVQFLPSVLDIESFLTIKKGK
jgi:CheY-like chemotaxis protein